MSRGGTRSGSPGTKYQNRSDLRQPVRVAPGQQYGQGQQLAAAQHAIPLPNQAAGPAPAVPTPQAAAGPVAMPGAMPFDRPTEQPNVPVTSGLPTGPGPGPEALAIPPAPDLIGAQLRAVFAAYPNDDLVRVMALRDQQPQQ